jgi:hypothetical protein
MNIQPKRGRYVFDERRYVEAIPPQLFDEMISDYAASLPATATTSRQRAR